MTLDVYGFPSGTWTAYPFISSEKITQSGGDVVANYWTVPTTNAIQLKALTSGVAAYIRAENIATNRISILATASSTGVSYSASNNFITIRFASKSFSDPLVAGEKRIAVDSFTLAANETKTIYEGNVTVDADIYLQGGRAWLSLNSAEYTTSSPFGAAWESENQ